MKSIHELPLSLGIHSTYKGYHYLVTALELAIQNEDNLIFVTKNIFPIVGKEAGNGRAGCGTGIAGGNRQSVYSL